MTLGLDDFHFGFLDETVDYRKKFDENSHNVSPVDRNSKPVIPDRPGGLTRPSSIIKQQPRHSLDSLDPDSGVS